MTHSEIKNKYIGSLYSFVYRGFTRHKKYYTSVKQVIEEYLSQKPERNTPDFIEHLPDIFPFIQRKLKHYWSIYKEPAVT